MNTEKIGKILKNMFTVFIIVALSSMVVMVFINAVLRYTINQSITETEELSRFAFMWTIFLGIIVAHKDNNHVSVDMLVEKLMGRPLKVVTILSKIITMAALVFILIGGIGYTKHAMTYRTAATGTNFGLISISIVIMAAALIIIDIYKMLTIVKPDVVEKLVSGDTDTDKEE